ncbi:DUF397 domain-containing protein [Kitasatospora kifunensis]|uniref:DUF397 domain-containing protein n=1 Tax=Kitasatospora kifunensis TaxID=58351 RepID=A0A7W7RA49_KITKI|nr:DUF397 domain-containing protein [Kitasatospora kifunensis]MBB4928218.1 hypothetical protein [Kitasatospora kifunensis]
MPARGSKNNGTGPVLAFAPDAWAGFIAGIKHGGMAG